MTAAGDQQGSQDPPTPRNRSNQPATSCTAAAPPPYCNISLCWLDSTRLFFPNEVGGQFTGKPSQCLV